MSKRTTQTRQGNVPEMTYLCVTGYEQGDNTKQDTKGEMRVYDNKQQQHKKKICSTGQRDKG